MTDLPKSTVFGKRIPKQKFYENLSVSQAMKRVFIDQINVIYWRNKIAPSTLNISAGETVSEIEIIEIELTSPQLDENVLRLIDKEIPYHIVFLLEYEGKYQAWTAYKEKNVSGNSAFKVENYYHTGWLPEEELPLVLEGSDTDSIYENLVRRIAGDALSEQTGETLKESVEREEKRRSLEKQIVSLQNKIRKEKQFNKQVQLNNELKKLRKELESI